MGDKSECKVTPKDYRTAVEIQDGCNLSGIVKAYADILVRICHDIHAAKGSTDEVNQHPISVLFADKIYDLATKHQRGENNHEAFSLAYSACMEKLNGDEG